MKYFSKEIEEEGYLYKTAGVKARDDVEDILRKKGFKEVYIPTVSGDREKASKVKKLTAHFKIRDIWKKKTAMIGEGDVLFVQYPTLEHSIFLSSVFRDLRKRGAKTRATTVMSLISIIPTGRWMPLPWISSIFILSTSFTEENTETVF